MAAPGPRIVLAPWRRKVSELIRRHRLVRRRGRIKLGCARARAGNVISAPRTSSGSPCFRVAGPPHRQRSLQAPEMRHIFWQDNRTEVSGCILISQFLNGSLVQPINMTRNAFSGTVSILHALDFITRQTRSDTTLGRVAQGEEW